MKSFYILMMVALLFEPMCARTVPKQESKRQLVLLGTLLGEALAPLFGGLAAGVAGVGAVGAGVAIANEIKTHSQSISHSESNTPKPTPTPTPTPGDCIVGECRAKCIPLIEENRAELAYLGCGSGMKCCVPKSPHTTTSTTTPSP